MTTNVTGAGRRPLGVSAVLAMALVVLVASTTTAVARLSGPEVRFAFVARGDNPIDALGAAPIAGRLDAPILLTAPTVLSDAAKQGLVDQDPDVVVIAGGPAAVSGDVERAIAGAVPDAQVRRVAGEDRYLTAEALAALVREYDPAFAYTATGSGGPEEDTNAYGIACPSGQVLTGISSEGAAVCAEDRDTDTVDGGDAETLDGLDSSQFARSGRVCPKGQVVTGILANASLACAPDQDGSGGTTYVSMHAYEFVGPSIDTIVYGVQRWVYREPGTDGPLYASVSLPHGATLRSMSVELMDRGTSDVQVALTRRPLDDFTARTIAYVRSTGSNGAGEVLTDDGLDEVIDNARYAYALTASAVGPWQGDDQGIEAVVFELDLP